MVDADDDGDMDVIATFEDNPNNPSEPGTTKVYLNPGNDDFTSVTPIEIEAPDKDTSDGEVPETTGVVVANTDTDRYPDIVTVNDAGENVYWGPTGHGSRARSSARPRVRRALEDLHGHGHRHRPPRDRGAQSPRSRCRWRTPTATASDIIVANFPTPDPSNPTST